MGGRGSASGIGGGARSKSNSGQNSQIVQKLEEFEKSLKSRFKTYQVGEALIAKTANNAYSVFDLKRIPINNLISHTVASETKTLKEAMKKATTLDELIKRDRKNRKVR